MEEEKESFLDRWGIWQAFLHTNLSGHLEGTQAKESTPLIDEGDQLHNP